MEPRDNRVTEWRRAGAHLIAGVRAKGVHAHAKESEQDWAYKKTVCSVPESPKKSIGCVAHLAQARERDPCLCEGLIIADVAKLGT